MKRGEVRWYEFQPPDKRRPVLILTRDSVLPHLHEVTIAPVTTTIRGIASEVRLSVGDGMPEECAANFHHLQTVPKRRLGRLLTTLSAEKLREVGACALLCSGCGDKHVDLKLMGRTTV